MRRKHWRGISLLLGIILMLGISTGCQIPIDEKMEEKPGLPVYEHMIPAKDPGIQLYLREKYVTEKDRYKAGEVVLFLEPFDIPTANAFDVEGWSWMEYLAGQGFDTWALDFRGFGNSTRPDEKVRADDAVKDVAAAVDYIKEKRKIDKVSIIGWGWGAVVGAKYAGDHPGNVHRLILYGAMHSSHLPEIIQTMESSPGVMKEYPNYELRTYDAIRQYWAKMMNGRDLVKAGVMADVGEAYFLADSESEKRNPKAIRQNLGPLLDLYQMWNNTPIYDPGKIKAPTLVVRGDEDIFADPDLIDALTGTEKKKEVVIRNSTHWVLYEKHRDELLAVVLNFLLN